MESTGRPGQIHISEKTHGFLENKYIAEPGEEVEGKPLLLAFILYGLIPNAFLVNNLIYNWFHSATSTNLLFCEKHFFLSFPFFPFFSIDRIKNLLHHTAEINKIL